MKAIFQIAYILSKIFDGNEKFTLGAKLLIVGFVIGETLVPSREEKDCSLVERLENNLKDFLDVGDVVSLIKKL